MNDHTPLLRAELIELYDAQVAYMTNPGIPSQLNLTRVLVHNLTQSIVDQFLQYLPDGPVEELVVWSPFTDRKLEALDALVGHTRPRRVLVGVQPDLTSLDGARLATLASQQAHEVSHVVSPKAKRLDLRPRRHTGHGHVDGHRTTEERAEPARIAYVIHPDAGVDEHEAVRVGLDQQAVRN